MSDNPHDALFQFTFSSVEHAAAVLRSALPAEVAERIDWSTLAPMPGSFVDAKLDGRRSDLLFAATLAGHPSLLYLLFEHQSYGDELLLLRLLEYMTRIWRAYLQDHPKAKRLPIILPVVLHHSERGWRAATKLDQLLAGDDTLLAVVGRFVPRYEIVLDDISELDGEALRKRAITALGKFVLYLFRYARTPKELFEGMSRWREVIIEVTEAPRGGDAISAVLMYLQTISRKSEEEVIMAIQDSTDESFADQTARMKKFLDAMGLLQGLAALVRQFERRLGRALSAEERGKLANRLRDEGPEKVGDVILDLEKAELAAWLNGSG
ncbi:Rpn family recombination-promoting nuclease/putative transposase [Polyangium sp. y55x31]|uniref:Rpn family recombination-promoting nuclease/putative transposase n=1 Tax=Polyangium sp. y55x31 TaxID=3042688 RepID=UPI00248224CF|nr:Rpn family recombination-promoting nuclease/putative transposase [Polyangium sp. y55x31]MDI1478007.1 Rpn family recombination-promoting nuclease/putative transposase [Polyangium sp. y55x31]